MATLVSQKVYGFGAAKAVSAASKEIARLENLLSFFLPLSEISAINAAAGIKGEEVSPETFYLLKKAIEIKEESRGVLNIAMGSLFDLWRRALEEKSLPDTREIEQAKQLIESTDILKLTEPDTAFLRVKGLKIDPGAIGKGFIADKAMEIYRRQRIKSAYIIIGGNVSLLGARPDGSPWRVGISDPDSPNNCIGYLEVEDRSVVTSGDYEKFTIINGTRYHHIIDIRTGYPAESGLRSVTVVTDKSILADALATAAFILGLEKGKKLLDRYGADGLFIDSKRKIHQTPGLTRLLTMNTQCSKIGV